MVAARLRRCARNGALGGDLSAGEMDASMRSRLGSQALLYFTVLLVVFALLGVGVYQVICSSVYRVVDESLLASKPVAAAVAESMGTTSAGESLPAGEEAGVGMPAMTTMADSLADASFASIILLRDEQGALVDIEGLYSAYPDSLRNAPFKADRLDRIEECRLDGHAYRMVTYRIEAPAADGADRPVEFMQVLIGVDSEKAIVEHAGAALTAYLFLAVIISAAAGMFFSSRASSSLMASWRSQAEFVQNASHELKTPLAVIQASGEVLLGQPESRIVDCFEVVDAMVEESRRMSGLVDDLMQLAASDAGRMDVDIQPVDIDRLVASCANRYLDFTEVQGKGLEVDARFGDTVRLDEAKVWQLLGILLDNALKYTDAGDRIGVDVARDGSQLVIRVWDTGRGVTDEERESAFKRFYRSDGARASSAGGMGLGLSLAQAIASAHGGTISLEPNEPRGAVATVRLPLSARA